MCRFLVYKGRDSRFSVRVSDLVVHPVHSIIHQSYDCRERITEGLVPPALNGDGFGIGWYHDAVAGGDGKPSQLSSITASPEPKTDAHATRGVVPSRGGACLPPSTVTREGKTCPFPCVFPDNGSGTALCHGLTQTLEVPPDARGVDSLCHSHVRSVKRVRSEVSLAALYASIEDEAERLAGGCSDKDDGLTAAERRDRDIDLKPGVYTSTEPAWNNMNLVRLSEKLR
jgi:hypothetical protein